MPAEVRVGDTVNVKRANGDVVTAEVVSITNQNSISVDIYHEDEAALKTTVAVTRATAFPAAADEFWKMA